MDRAPLQGQAVLVMGMGRSGQAAAALALARGAEAVVCTDLRPDLPVPDGIRAVYGRHEERDFEQADLVVVSPGIPPRAPLLEKAHAAGARVVGELAFAAEVVALHGVPLLGITGTNGKSTTTWLLGQLLAQAGRRCFVGGNLGTPLSLLALDLLGGAEIDVAVVEISSYQLELVGALRPAAGAILNLRPDHLERHGSMPAYAAAKLALFRNMGAEGVALLPCDEALLPPEAVVGPAVRLIGGRPGVVVSAGVIELTGWGADYRVPIGKFSLLGAHNRENLAAALALALCAGVDPTSLDLGALMPLAHRLELVHEADGVRWINDSKATNVDAAAVGITAAASGAAASAGGLVVLLGGDGKKGADYTELLVALEAAATAIVCFGRSGPEIARQLSRFQGLHAAADLSSAVAVARRLARPGGVVLLSPACASFDEFTDFEHRGRFFAALARGAPGSPGGCP